MMQFGTKGKKRDVSHGRMGNKAYIGVQEKGSYYEEIKRKKKSLD